MSLIRRRRAAVAAALATLLMPWAVLPMEAGADPVPRVEAAVPGSMLFPAGGGTVYTNVSLERQAHVREAALHLEGEPVLTRAVHRLNMTTVGAGQANAWWGATADALPAGPVESFLVVPFNTTQINGAAVYGTGLATAPATASNYTFQVFVFQVSAANPVAVNVTWAGHAYGGAGPNYSGEVFLFNFTDQSWFAAGSYPAGSTGVQNVSLGTGSAANFVKAGTGSVVVLVVSGTSDASVNTEAIEVTVVAGMYPRPAVDVGGDGSYEWRFDAPGWGQMGRQTVDVDGLGLSEHVFQPGGSNSSAQFLVPTDAAVESASVQLIALPASGSTNASGVDRTVGANGSTAIGVSGLANNSVGRTGYVTLRNVTTLNATTVSNLGVQGGDINSGSDPNGYRRAAQTFNITSRGTLSSISFFMYQFQGNPGPLVLTLESLNLTGMPSGIIRDTQTIPQSQLGPNQWITFSGLAYTPIYGQTLVAVLSFPSAPPDTASNFGSFGATLGNSFDGGESLSYVNVTGVGETWVRPADTDLLFRLAQDIPSPSADAQDVLVDSTSGTYSQFNNVSTISFVIDSPLLTNGSHTFLLTNSNPLSLRFNWSLQLDYSRIADHLEVGAVGLPSPFAVLDNLTTGVELRLEPVLAALLPNTSLSAPGPPSTNLTQVTLVISSTSEGRVQITNLDIRYSMTFRAAGLGPAFDAYLWTTPSASPRADVPVAVYSPGPTTLNILSAEVLYDHPPEYFGFPTTTSLEDIPLLFDLNTVFHDDFDNANLSYTFTTPAGSANASVALIGRYNLSITPLADVAGTVVVNVTALDSSGLRNSSREVTFEFQAVNDPPRLLVSQINVTWGAVTAVDLTPFLSDPDDPVAAATITSATGGSVSLSGRTLIFNLSAGAADFPLNLTVSDGTTSANYTLLVHPRVSDTPPSLAPIPSIEFAWDGAYRIDLGLYASDVEDALSALSFTFNLTTGNASGLLWVVEETLPTTYLKLIPRAGVAGNYTGVLTVTDPDGNTNATTLGVRVFAPPNRPPTIVGLPAAIVLGGEPYTLTLATKSSDREDTAPSLFVWSVESDGAGLFAFSYDEATQVLVVEAVPGAKGTGSITLTLRDSDGLTDTRTVPVAVDAPAAGGATVGEAAIMLSLVFALVVIGSAVAIRLDRSRGKGGASRRRRAPQELGALGAEPPGDETPALAAPPMEGGSPAEVGEFLRGMKDAPAPPEEGVAVLGVHHGLGSPAAAEGAVLTPATISKGPAPAPPARLGELYLFGLKDGSMVFQEPARGLPALSPADENSFLQWAFDTARDELDRAGDARVTDRDGQAVLLARGQSFFIAGRVEGTDTEALLASVTPLVVEVDHEFPGTPADWQRADILDTVTDILRRLVK